MRKFLIVALLACIPTSAGAQYFQAEMMKQRQQQKAQSRWTLSDYLAQKQKIRLMDLWLAANRDTPWFELGLGAAHSELEADSTTAVTSEHAEASLHIFFLGVEADYQKSDQERTATSIHGSLRLLGASQQSTRLNIHYGWSEFEFADETRWGSTYLGGSLNLYIASFMGVEGHYRSYLSEAAEHDLWKAGAFLEWGVLRIFGRHSVEGSPNENTRSGWEAGVQLYF